MKTDLQPLHGLRALGTIGIFLFHAGLLPQGTFPVTLFFMLSGFLMYYTKASSNALASFKSWVTTYVYKKWKAFYPLHILTFVVACCVHNVFSQPLEETIPSAILNLLLVHPFFKEYAIGFNNLSWYLAVTMFLYVMSYFFLRCLSKIRNPLPHIIVTLSIITFLNLATRLGVSLYLYTNPLYRILDFWLGMLIAKAYTEDKFELRKENLIEFLLVIAFLLQYAVSLIVDITPGYYSILFSAALYIFAKSKGFVSKFLSCSLLKTIAYYSFEFYMIHELVLHVFWLLLSDRSMNYLTRCLAAAVPSLIITVFFTVAYKKLITAIKQKHKPSKAHKT